MMVLNAQAGEEYVDEAGMIPKNTSVLISRVTGRPQKSIFTKRGRGALEKKMPPAGYICHRCKVPGHFIQHCPKNDDPNYDIKRVKLPVGIPRSMLMATPGSSYTMPSELHLRKKLRVYLPLDLSVMFA